MRRSPTKTMWAVWACGWPEPSIFSTRKAASKDIKTRLFPPPSMRIGRVRIEWSEPGRLTIRRKK